MVPVLLWKTRYVKLGRTHRWLRDLRFFALWTVGSLGSVVLFCVILALLPVMVISRGVLLAPELARVLRWWSNRARDRVGRYRGDPVAGPTGTLTRDALIDDRLRFALSRDTGRDVLWLALDAIPTLFLVTVILTLPFGVLHAVNTVYRWLAGLGMEPASAPDPVLLWPAVLSIPLLILGYLLVLVVLIPLAAHLYARASAALLALPRRALLAERVDALTLSRAAALDAHAAELRRIERDLHDGAQNRIVGIVMMLGMAERAIENGDPTARDHVRRAQDAASEALAGLRHTVHDIYPPILEEQGLDGALASLAGRSVVPCTLDAAGIGRVPAAIESAAYFVVAEALNNLNKNATASRASVRVRREAQLLTLEVEDNGSGGAIERPGGGIAGIRRRALAFEGTLELISPVGGPTIIRVEIPCAS